MTDNALTKVDGSNEPVLSTVENLNQGTRLKFVDGRWSTADGREMTGKKLLVIHMTRALRRWHEGGPPEDISEDAGPLPDHEAMNAAIPQSEWRRGLNGEPEKPWQLNFPVYLIDLDAFEIFTSINSTWGQKTAWVKLNTQIKFCSAIKKIKMHPVVKLGSSQMGGKMQKLRPDFTIMPDEWVSFSDLASLGELKPAIPPSLGEEMGRDEIPF